MTDVATSTSRQKTKPFSRSVSPRPGVCRQKYGQASRRGLARASSLCLQNRRNSIPFRRNSHSEFVRQFGIPVTGNHRGTPVRSINAPSVKELRLRQSVHRSHYPVTRRSKRDRRATNVKPCSTALRARRNVVQRFSRNTSPLALPANDGNRRCRLNRSISGLVAVYP